MSDILDARGLRGTCRQYAEVQYEFEPASGTVWGWMNQRGNPCFNLGLLKDIRAFGGDLTANSGHVDFEGAMHKVHYYVAGSRVPRVYNLGGDLALFLLLIRARDRDALAHYAKLCIDNIHARVQNYFCPTLTTISLVQGDALGGGFETALASDVVVAEESAMLGLPEILFNLFPGMGAYSLLARRASPRIAEELILSGKILPAAKLHEMGIIDVLAKDGEGESAVQTWIAKNTRRRNGHQAVMQVRKQVNPITRDELDAVVDTWVDCALRLEDRDMRMMSRVVRAQMERMEAATAAADSPAVAEAGVAMAAG
ncbi:MAG TPA: crotonase/enoyl-CoA hydratase family protein [Burkholderiales bacterium]|nr:crotonase/enoyl-CoA hydratase family protein [Burkholderiales bacterium]